MRLFACGALLVVCLTPFATRTVRAADAGLVAGFGVVDITPRLDGKQPIYLAGLEMDRQAKQIHDPLFARAVVVGDGKQKIALVSVDSIGLPNPAVQHARAELKDFGYVLVASTHSHATPDVVGIWGPSQGVSGVSKEYVRQVEQGIVAAVREADKLAVASKAEYGTAADQSLLGDYRLPKVYDSVMRVLRFNRADNGKPLGILVQWNSHGVEPSKNPQVTRDFMGVVVDTLEKRHECKAVYFQGAIGGLMGTPNVTVRDDAGEVVRDPFKLIQVAGEAIAGLADRALAKAEPIRLTPLAASAKPTMIPLANEGFRQARAAGILDRSAYLWTGNRDERGAEVPAGKTDPNEALQSEVAYLRLGELHVAAIPGELYPELVYGEFQDPVDPGADFLDAPLETPITKILPSDKMLVLGLANDELGYIVPKRQWDVVAPFCYGRTSSQYGERNSVGPDTARHLMEALADRVREAK